MFLDIPDIISGDWWSVQTVVNQLRFRLGTDASPTYTGLTLTGLTASTLIGANASKELESVTIGTGLNYTRPTLSLSHLGIEDLTDPGGDRVYFWDDSETASGWLAAGNSIAITTTTIDTIQDIRTSATPQFAGLGVGATGSADSIIIQTDDTVDPTLIFKTTNTANQINVYLDESQSNDYLRIAGQTDAKDTIVTIDAIDAKDSILRLYSGNNFSYISHNSSDNLTIANFTSDKDLIFSVVQGFGSISITWDADTDKLKHSEGEFDFDNDNIITTGTINGSSGTVLVTDNATNAPSGKSDGYIGVAEVGGTARLYFAVEGTMYYIDGTAAAVPVTGNPIGLLLALTYNLA